MNRHILSLTAVSLGLVLTGCASSGYAPEPNSRARVKENIYKNVLNKTSRSITKNYTKKQLSDYYKRQIEMEERREEANKRLHGYTPESRYKEPLGIRRLHAAQKKKHVITTAEMQRKAALRDSNDRLSRLSNRAFGNRESTSFGGGDGSSREKMFGFSY